MDISVSISVCIWQRLWHLEVDLLLPSSDPKTREKRETSKITSIPYSNFLESTVRWIYSLEISISISVPTSVCRGSRLWHHGTLKWIYFGVWEDRPGFRPAIWPRPPGSPGGCCRWRPGLLDTGSRGTSQMSEYIPVSRYIYIYVHTLLHIYTSTYTDMYLQIYRYSIHRYIYIYIYLFIYICTERVRERERESE